MFRTLRQYLFPQEFRIAAPEWPADIAIILGASLGEAAPTVAEKTGAHARLDTGAQSQLDPKALAELGTGLWRLRQRMVDPATGQPRETMRRAFRHLESTWDALRSIGVEIQDHTDAAYDTGQSLTVIAFQPTPELQHEKVLETIRPSVYLAGKRVQMGEVIVGVPA